MSKPDDLAFLTTDMNDDYNEAATSAQAAPLFGEAEETTLALAVLVYMFSGMFTSNFVLVCVVCILLLAFDFWTVKNVSGRLMVGLRWWNYVKEDGATEWVFESADDASEISDVDRRVFWGALYAPAVEARQRIENFASGGVAGSLINQVGIGNVISGIGSLMSKSSGAATGPQAGVAAV
ncbi:hypothetical protein JL721_4543 [Aureococcus anophagefferens]|nr:hypothetical protein JL721_4543 [Aureococcus anophagefferens]